jgi:hypothetical protein
MTQASLISMITNSSDKSSKLVYGGFFEIFHMVHSKNNLKNNYLILKLNYFISFLITISHLS